jgi:hypothetical protein
MLAMISALWDAYRRGAGPRRVVVEPRDNVESLAGAIAALDARHDSRDASLSDEEYTAQRTALKARLSAALAAGPAAE